RTGGIQCGRAGRIALRLTHSALRRDAGVRQAGRTIPAAVHSAAAAAAAPPAKMAGQARAGWSRATERVAGTEPALCPGYGPAVESTLRAARQRAREKVSHVDRRYRGCHTYVLSLLSAYGGGAHHALDQRDCVDGALHERSQH